MSHVLVMVSLLVLYFFFPFYSLLRWTRRRRWQFYSGDGSLLPVGF